MKMPVNCVVLAAGLATLAPAAPAFGQSRGALLYSTHCIACHTEQVHWRQKRLVTDWTGLKAQVWRWQADAALAWSDDDVAEVARHLNEEFYRFPEVSAAPGSSGFATRWEFERRHRAPATLMKRKALGEGAF